MRSRSDLWKSIVASGDFQIETVVRIYGATGSDADATSGSDSVGNYKEYSTITAPVITRNLLGSNDLSVGNCSIGVLNFSLFTTDRIPKSARMLIRSRPYSGVTYAEWMNFGTFYIDSRSKIDNLITITAYDSMKMGQQAYNDTSVARKWPKKIKTVVTRIAEQMGLSIDSRTRTQVINSDIGNMSVVLMPGANDSLLDILGHIGGIIGGNWTITSDDKLRFISTTTIPIDSNYLIDSSSSYDYIGTESGDALIWMITSETPGGSTEEEVLNVPVVIGSLNTSRQYSITKVTMSINDEHVYSYGTNSGFELLIENNPYATPGLAKSLFQTINGITYTPYSIENARYDPAAEIGDVIIIGGSNPIISILFNETRTFGIVFSANASAPSEHETETEYPYKTAWQRMKYEIDDTRSAFDEKLESKILQTQTEILQYVAHNYTTKDEADTVEVSTYTQIDQTAEKILLMASRTYTTKGETGELTERVQNAELALEPDSIKATVSEEFSKDGVNLEDRLSSIEMYPTSIVLTVKETLTDPLNESVNEALTELSLMPGKLEAKVSKDSVIASIVASIESGDEEDEWRSVVSIVADEIDLSGYVTFTSLSTPGETTIDGENITTGYISFDRMQGGQITLGGTNNGSGSLRINDNNDVQIGGWDNQGLSVNKGNIDLDNSSLIRTYLSSNKRSYLYFGGSLGSGWSNTSGFRMVYGDSTIELTCTYEEPATLINGYYSPLFKMRGVVSASDSGSFELSPDSIYWRTSSLLNSATLNSNLSYTALRGNKTLIIDNTTQLVGSNQYISWGGDLTVSGTKSRVVETDQYSQRALYCYETPSPMFGDVGEGVIADDGNCYVWFESVFAQTITTQQYQVFIQRYSDGECYVSRRTGSYFVVSGTPGLTFGWEVKAKQRDYEQLRLGRVDIAFNMDIQPYGEYAAMHIDAIRKEREVA